MTIKENTFQEDLSIGLQIETQVLNIIRKKYPSASIINKYKGYDIWIPEIKKGIEVKYDGKSKYTGNIVIEIEMYDKPSALLTSEADIWIFYDGNEFICIEKKYIYYAVFMAKLTYVEFVGKGDNVSKKAFLIKKEDLFKYGKQIDLI
jgi:hypothetical protein